jgi:hypothetical protein
MIGKVALLGIGYLIGVLSTPDKGSDNRRKVKTYLTTMKDNITKEIK